MIPSTVGLPTVLWGNQFSKCQRFLPVSNKKKEAWLLGVRVRELANKSWQSVGFQQDRFNVFGAQIEPLAVVDQL